MPQTSFLILWNSDSEIPLLTTEMNEALPGVLGIQGEGLFIFRDLGRRAIYFQDLGSFWSFKEQGAGD